MSETKIVAIPMKYNGDLLRRDVKTMMTHCGLTVHDVDAMMQVQVVRSVLNSAKTDYMPTLRNFVLLCNTLDLNPRRYFELDLEAMKK